MSRYSIRPMGITELKGFYKHIEKDFSRDEYAPYNILSKQLREGIQEGLVFTDEEEDAAYSVCAAQNENGYVLISLLAVFQEHRNRGIGTDFLKALNTRYAGKQAILAEVEKPEISETPEERDFRKRRIAFYEKAGFYLVPGVDYSIWDVPMHLMALPVKASKEAINAGIGMVMHEIYLRLMGEKFIHKMRLRRFDEG